MPIFTLRKIEAYFLKSGKTRKTVKRTEELLNDIFHDNIMCKKDEEFFYVKASVLTNIKEQFVIITVHAVLEKEVSVIICMDS